MITGIFRLNYLLAHINNLDITDGVFRMDKLKKFQIQSLSNFKDLFKYVIEEDTADTTVVKGEGIKAMIAIVDDMLGRGVPDERNDYGFNKNDWDYFSRFFRYNVGGDELLLINAIEAVRRLNKYSRTQLSNFRAVEAEVIKDIKKARKDNVDVDKSDSGDKVIFDYNDKSYNKISVTFPTEPNVRLRNKILREYLTSIDQPQDYDQFGKYDFVDKFKFLSKHKTKLNSYYIVPELAKKMAESLFPNIEIEEKGLSVADDGGTTSPTSGKPKIKILGKERTPFGEKLIITLGDDPSISKRVYFNIKGDGHTPKLLSYQKTPTNTWRILISDDKQAFETLKPYLENDLDISDLQTHFEQKVDVPQTEDSQKYNLIINYIGNNSIKITTDFKSTPSIYKDFFKQAVKYLFPDYQWDSQEYKYVIQGDYEQYIMLGSILKDNFNVDDLRDIVLKMKEENMIKPARDKKLKDRKEVDGAIDSSFKNSAFNLYDLQKEGIEFLYKNKYAILGSETGGGKTVQMIYAAELVYREKELPILIVTLKRVQKQFVDEIIAVMGEGEKSQISTDPMKTEKWNVLYYDNFSSGKNLQAVMDHLVSQEYSVIILDELHKVKHGTAKRSKNIELVANKSQNRWGATATISANKPFDVRNQLSILGHPIGRMKEGRFKKEFAGMVPEGYGGAYVENPDFEGRLMAAENLNKWLHLSGVYIRHSKEDMRSERSEKMPDLNIKKNEINAIKDVTEFSKKLKAKVMSYNDPQMEVSKLLAYRNLIATEKTDSTIEIALNIVKNNYKNPENNYSASKILIFTNFIEAGDQLLVKATEGLKKLNPKWKAYSFLSATPKKELELVKSRMEEDDSKILVMSMKMGGTGISFPNTFKTMIVNDYDWTPESVEQSEGRIYRINTNQNVDIIYNINRGLDNELYSKVEKKKQLAKIIQTYRKIYQQEKTTSKESDTLRKIINAQKELAKIESEEMELTSKELPTIDESFKMYLRRKYLT